MNCDDHFVELTQDVERVNSQLKEFASGVRNIEYFDATSYLCPEGWCSAFDQQGAPMYFDSSHLSIKGSWSLGELIFAREGVPSAFRQIPEWLSITRREVSI